MSKAAPKSPVFGPNPLDVRVRERFLGSGQLDAKVLDKHLGELPDVGNQADGIGLRQPALTGAGDADDADE